MCPGVVRLEYHLHDNGDEVAVIRLEEGNIRRVEVTGLNLQESAAAVLEALGKGVA